jgi:16S rRNA (adenine1518-N6/adenine1519-N6)-dimethyltransferase
MRSPRPRKRFGQHFLRDRAVVLQMLSALHPQRGELVVEIGPGRGALTLDLLDAMGKIDAVELDRDLVPLLQERCRGRGELRLHHADALTFDLSALAEGSDALRLVGNLPYNIATPLVFRMMNQLECIRDMHFMVQKEFADRLVAAPGGRDYGRLSVMVQLSVTVESLFRVPPEAFFPKPKVESCFVRLKPWRDRERSIADRVTFTHVVAAAFGQRRKKLRNALKGVLDGEAIRACGVDPNARAEKLDVEAFARLSDAVSLGSPKD